MIQAVIGKIFGTRNDKILKHYQSRVKRINALEPELQKLDDAALQQRFQSIKDEIRQKIANSTTEEDESLSIDIINTLLDSNLEEVFALTREASRRILNMRHFDVQLIGGMTLHDGRIAEMKTGEGKTLVATLPVILNALAGKSVHTRNREK